MMNVSVVGLGKAGLPLAAVIAEAGINVIGVDIDKKRVEMINHGENPLPEEAELEGMLRLLGGKKLKATTDYAEAITKCTAHIVIVPLFIDKNKKCDFAILKKAFESIAEHIKEGDLVVLETTVPIGTTEKLAAETIDKKGIKYHLAYSPERIMTGYSISRYKEFPKVVSGRTPESCKKVEDLYKTFCKEVNKVRSIETAELVKISEGIYRDVNIALANELFMLCEKNKIDFFELRKAANHKFCEIHEPGNVGGHCIPVYPWFLINNFNVPLIKTARQINDDMIEYYADKIKEKIGDSGTVGVIGLSYREGVKEKAYSRSIPLINLLKKRGYSVYGLDCLYNAEETSREFGVDQIKDVNEMDAIILMNKDKEFLPILRKVRSKVIDVKNMLN